MSSRIRTLQARVITLILTDSRFAVAPSAQAMIEGAELDATKIPVIADLPGDIATVVDRALAATGLAVIVWTPSYLPAETGAKSGQRTFRVRAWIMENVTLNRATEGAATAEECVEAIDAIVSGRAAGLMPNPRQGMGQLELADDGVQPVGGEDAELNQFEITWEVTA